MLNTVIIVVFSTMLLFMTLNASAVSEELDLAPGLLEEIETGALRPYFNALKSGNVEKIGRYITGKKREQAQLSKHEDKEFQDLLRRYYKGAIFTVERAINLEDQIIVDVLIEFPGRGRKRVQFFLQDQNQQPEGGGAQITGGRHWMINDEQRSDGRDKQ